MESAEGTEFNPQGIDAAGQPLQPDGQPVELEAVTGPGPAITRQTIIARAETWLHPPVPYSQTAFKDRYRTDCSGYVSMAWQTNRNYWTGDLDTIGVPITYNDLRPGDMLLYHNPSNPHNGSHVVLFDRWVGAVGDNFYIYEQTGSGGTKHRLCPVNYSRSRYKPFRYVNVYVHGSYSGDSLADLLVLDTTTGLIRYFPNNGPGNWGPQASIGSGWTNVNPSCLYFADMNGDGRADLLSLDTSTGLIWYFPNNGPGNWGPQASIGSGWSGINPSCLYFA